MRVRIMRPTNIEYRARLVFSGECRVSTSHRCTPSSSSPATSVQQGLQSRAHAANSCTTREPQIANETPDPGDQAFVSCSILASSRFLLFKSYCPSSASFFPLGCCNFRYVILVHFPSPQLHRLIFLPVHSSISVFWHPRLYLMIFCLVMVILLSASSSWGEKGWRGER